MKNSNFKFLPCSKYWSAAGPFCRGKNGFSNFFHENPSEIQEYPEIIFYNSQVVDVDADNDDKNEVDDAEYYPKCKSIVVVRKGLR